MAGFSFGSLFTREANISDDGKLEIEGLQDFAGRNATQVIANAAVAASGNSTIYTVPASKIFYMAHYNFTAISAPAATTNFTLTKNLAGVPAVVFRTSTDVALLETIFMQGSLTMPIRLIAAETLSITSNHANGFMEGTIHGWLEDA